jgi:predicted amidophosphoribosyltransferase
MRKVCPKDTMHSPYVNPGDTYCTICGTKLEDKNMVCECGKDYGVADHFCADCGRPLK